MMNKQQRLDEKSLARVWQMASSDDGLVFAIISAFRGENSLDENKKRNSELKKDIRKEGLGFFELEGHWVENEGKPNEEDVKEDSFFVSLSKTTKNAPEKLRKFILQQVRKWEQESAIIKPNPDKKDIHLLLPNGKTENLGRFTPQKIAQAYSRFKDTGRTFVFERAVSPRGWSGTLVDLVEEKKVLTESGLSRIWQHMTEHDCGTITAWRSKRECNTGVRYTKKENQKRNRSLLAKLQAKRYGVTSIDGYYIEDYGTPDAEEVGEDVFFVVDLQDKGNLEQDLKKLGEEFEQDSIMFIPKGRSESRLIGTNHCPNGYPGYGKVIKFGKRGMGSQGEFFSKVRGRPFVFYKESILREHVLPEGYFGRMACSAISEQHWSEVEVDDEV